MLQQVLHLYSEPCIHGSSSPLPLEILLIVARVVAPEAAPRTVPGPLAALCITINGRRDAHSLPVMVILVVVTGTSVGTPMVPTTPRRS